MSTSLAQLVAPPTAAQTLQTLLQLLQQGGFPATSWQSGSAGPVLTNAEAQALSSLGTVLASIATGGYLALPGQPTSGAQGAWLDLLGTQVFQTPRSAAAFTKGSVVLADAAGAGPFTITPAMLWVGDASKTFLFNSTNTTNLTLPLNGTLTVPVIAQFAGAAYNLANNAITFLQTSMPGVTVTNPTVSVSQSWIVSVGTDAESDALYTARLAAKWSTIGSGSLASSYFYNATTPSITGTSEVTQCTVSTVGGVVQVVVAGPNGPISGTALAAVNTALQAIRPLTVQVNTANAIASQTVIAGTVFVKSAFDLSATLSAVQVALSQLFASVPIAGTLYKAQLFDVIMSVPGVYNVTISAPSADVVLGATTVLTPLYLLTSSR